MEAPEETLYPNPPLVEVVFELQFPGNMAVECKRHLFWEKVRSDYPNILVPRAKPDQPLALEPYRFERADGSAGIAVALHRFALYVRKYEGYPAFRTEFLRVLEQFNETFHVEKLSRAGWRYVNLIPFVRVDGVVPLERFLRMGLDLPDSVPRQFGNLNLVFECKEPNGIVTTRLLTMISPDRQEALLLDFDFGRVGDDLRFGEVGNYIVEAHAYTRKLFEDLITDEYRTYLKGEVL
jgi:uncharacterized protein (TIGR04255 family)